MAKTNDLLSRYPVTKATGGKGPAGYRPPPPITAEFQSRHTPPWRAVPPPSNGSPQPPQSSNVTNRAPMNVPPPASTAPPPNQSVPQANPFDWLRNLFNSNRNTNIFGQPFRPETTPTRTPQEQALIDSGTVPADANFNYRGVPTATQADPNAGTTAYRNALTDANRSGAINDPAISGLIGLVNSGQITEADAAAAIVRFNKASSNRSAWVGEFGPRAANLTLEEAANVSDALLAEAGVRGDAAFLLTNSEADQLQALRQRLQSPDLTPDQAAIITGEINDIYAGAEHREQVEQQTEEDAANLEGQIGGLEGRRDEIVFGNSTQQDFFNRLNQLSQNPQPVFSDEDFDAAMARAEETINRYTLSAQNAAGVSVAGRGSASSSFATQIGQQMQRAGLNAKLNAQTEVTQFMKQANAQMQRSYNEMFAQVNDKMLARGLVVDSMIEGMKSELRNLRSGVSFEPTDFTPLWTAIEAMSFSNTQMQEYEQAMNPDLFTFLKDAAAGGLETLLGMFGGRLLGGFA